MKVTKKTISLILIAVMLASCFVVSGLSASAASGTLAKYYATNPNGQVGVKKTIKIRRILLPDNFMLEPFVF